MQITSRFTVAVQSLLCIYHFSATQKVTSVRLSESVGNNPVVIRRMLGQLQRAGFISVKPGIGGAEIIKPLAEISLLDVLRAVGGANEQLFRFQDNPEIVCVIGKNIHNALDSYLEEAKLALYEKLAAVNLQMVYDELEKYATKKPPTDVSDS